MNEWRGLEISIGKRRDGFALSMEFVVGREIFVLFGPSGAGKTLTLNAVAGLLEPDAGEIALDGEVFFRHRPQQPRINRPARERRVGYVFQNYALFPHLTAIENVGFALWRERDGSDRARQWLARMQLETFADRYPHELSGGQQQRVAIARALAAEPRVLLLDEPFSALDYPIRRQLHEELRRLQEESPRIVVYVTHNLDDAIAVGEKLAVVSAGRVAQSGPIDEVIKKPQNEVVADILGKEKRENAEHTE